MKRYSLSYIESFNGESGRSDSFDIMDTFDRSKIDELVKKYNLNAVELKNYKSPYEVPTHVFLIAEYEIGEEFRQDQLDLALQADREYKAEEAEREKHKNDPDNWWSQF